MADARWDVPETEEGLQTLLARLAESRAAGDDAAVGWGLLKLAWLVKWVRSDNHEPPFVRAGTLNDGALAIFRRIGDERGLLAALRAPSAFLPAEEKGRRLDEATAIAERSGDRREVALVLVARASALGLRNREAAARTNREALAIFRELKDRAGQARCLFGLAIQEEDDRAKLDAATEAAVLYREVGDLKQAVKSVMIAATNGEPAEIEPLLRQGLADAQEIGDRMAEGSFYGHLAKVAAKGDAEEAAKSLRWQNDMKESDGLNPEERRQNDLEMTKGLIAMAKASGNAETVSMFEKELRRLRRTKA